MKLEWKQIIIALLVGASFGAAIVLRLEPVCGRGDAGRPVKMREHMMDKFKSELKLTPEQELKVSAVLEETRGQMDALRDQVRPQFRQIREASKARIREILTPQQQKKFDVMSEKMEKRRKNRGPGMRE